MNYEGFLLPENQSLLSDPRVVPRVEGVSASALDMSPFHHSPRRGYFSNTCLGERMPSLIMISLIMASQSGAAGFIFLISALNSLNLFYIIFWGTLFSNPGYPLALQLPL